MSRRLTRLALLVAALVGVTAVALAYFSTSGTGTASATTGTFTPATISVPSSSGGSPTITWSTQATLPGNAALQSGITYRVERRTGSGTFAPVTTGGCAAPLPYGTVSCTDTVAGDGSYDYRVVAVYYSWTATSNTATVAVAHATKFGVAYSFSGTSVTAGTTFSVTATAQTAGGATVADYTGSVALSAALSPGPGAGTVTCTANTRSAVAGVVTFSGCHIDVTGTDTLHATDGTISGDSTAFTVTPAAAAKLAFVQQPSASSPAATPFAQQPKVAIQDAFGNVVTTDSTTSVLLALSGGTSGAALTCTPNPQTASSGVATFAGCQVDKAGTGYTLTASVITGLTPATSNAFAITTGGAAKLVFSTQPSDSTGGVVLPSAPPKGQPAVTVQDAGGNTVATDASAVTLTLVNAADGSAVAVGTTLLCTNNPQTASAGVATFAGCKVNKAGSYRLVAADGALTAATSSAFTITTGPAATLAISSGTPQSTTVSTGFADPLVALVTDAGGNPVSGVGVTFTAPASGPSGTFASSTSTTTINTNASGLASAAFTANGTAGGPYSVTAAASGTTPSSVSFALTNLAGNANMLAFTTQPSPSTGGTAFPTQPVVTVQDQQGNTINSGASVTLSLSGGASGATLTCGGTGTNGTTVTAVNGVATFTGCKVDKAGTGYTLAAAATGLAGATSSAFNITVGTAVKLGFATQPSGSATTGTAFGQQPVVAIQDAGGNAVTSNSSTAVTLALTTAGGATLTCTSSNSRTASSGLATFTGCAINTTGTYTLTATSSPALTSATSTTITVTTATQTATKLAFTTQPSPTGSTSGTAFAVQPVVAVQDASGNTVPGDTSAVTLTLSNSDGSTVATGTQLTCTANPKAAVAGVAAFAGCKVNKAGSYRLVATDGTLTSATSNTFAVTAGPAATLSLSTASSSQTAGSANNLTIAALDAGGNTATSYTGSKSLTFGGASAAPDGTLPAVTNSTGTLAAFGTSTSITFTNGVATVSASSNGVMRLYKAETASVTVSDGAISNATPATVTVSAGTPAKLAYTGAIVSAGTLSTTCFFTCSWTAIGGNKDTFKANVAATDANGNTVSNIGTSKTVTLTAAGSVSPASQVFPSTGSAVTGQFTYTWPGGNTSTDTVTAASSGLTSATVAASK